MDFKNIPTCQLVEELTKREGVIRKEISYGEPIEVKFGDDELINEGPCIVLVIYD